MTSSKSAPPKEREALYFDVVDDGAVVTLRGYIHRDDGDLMLTLVKQAALLGATGKLRLEHAFDPKGGFVLEATKGTTNVKEGNPRFPKAILASIAKESRTRGRRLA